MLFVDGDTSRHVTSHHIKLNGKSYGKDDKPNPPTIGWSKSPIKPGDQDDVILIMCIPGGIAISIGI